MAEVTTTTKRHRLLVFAVAMLVTLVGVFSVWALPSPASPQVNNSIGAGQTQR